MDAESLRIFFTTIGMLVSLCVVVLIAGGIVMLSAELIHGFTRRLNSPCPHCNGRGWVRKEEG